MRPKVLFSSLLLLLLTAYEWAALNTNNAQNFSFEEVKPSA